MACVTRDGEKIGVAEENLEERWQQSGPRRLEKDVLKKERYRK